jgi:phytoene dehydrogenase-like protein
MSRRRQPGRAIVIGAGLAGLRAALSLRDAKVSTTVFEASPHLGGRCRSYDDPELGLIDNGTHALTAANPVALALIERLKLAPRWAPSAGGALQLVDVPEQRVFKLRPKLRDFIALGLRPQHALPFFGRDRPVAALFEEDAAIYRRLIEPLTVAALNTDAREASSRLLARILIEGWRGPKALMPLIAERGLGPDLVEPLADQIRAIGGEIRTTTRVRALTFEEGRVAAVEIGDESIRLSDADQVILAVPPAEAERLTGFSFGLADSPIVNAHFAVDGAHPSAPMFIGVIGATAQWILWRKDVVAVTVSAADDLVSEPQERIADVLWSDVRAALQLATGTAPSERRSYRVVKERRATIRQTPGLVRPGAVTAWPNLFLAGDWTDTGLPATIEGSLCSGVAAARAALR